MAWSLSERFSGIEHAEQAIVLFEKAGNKRWLAYAYMNLMMCHKFDADPSEAKEYIESALVMARLAGDKWCEAAVLRHKGIHLDQLVGGMEGVKFLEEGLALARKVGERASIGLTLLYLGGIYCRAGKLERAEDLAREGIAVYEELRDRRGRSIGLVTLGSIYKQRAEWDLAGGCCREALEILVRELGIRWFVPKCLEGLAAKAWAEGNYRQAARIFGAADADRERHMSTSPAWAIHEYDDVRDSVRSELGDQAYSVEWGKSSALSGKDVMEFAQAQCMLSRSDVSQNRA